MLQLIYCSTDRIIDKFDKNNVNIGYRDPDRDDVFLERDAFMDGCRSDNHETYPLVQALTINYGSKKDWDGNDNQELVPDTIQLCPWWLRQLAGPPPKWGMSDELVKKAADKKAKGLLGKLTAKLNNERATPIDSLATFEHVLLHEVRGLLGAGAVADRYR